MADRFVLYFSATQEVSKYTPLGERAQPGAVERVDWMCVRKANWLRASSW
jgi:hypothetical protein